MVKLTQEQVDTFHREGLLCVENFLLSEQVQTLKQRAQDLLDNFDVSTHPKTQFRTNENDHIGDQYFFDSADKVSFFFDVDAFDEAGNLLWPKQRAINKLGHGLHMHEPVFREVTFDDLVKDVARALDFKDPRVLQSMCIFKQPDEVKGGERDNAVPPHTDAWFLYTEPQSALGFWFALEDCDEQNGCLSYNPGSHKTFPIKKRFAKVDGGDKGCNFVDVPNDEPIPEDDPAAYKPVPCKAGSLVLIHNLVLHKSEKNRLSKSRYVYAFHVIDGVAKYDEKNWLQVPPCKEGGQEFSKLYEETKEMP
ncbi:phytanoyl-CoA dioxygenase [Suhomyces tanzawaensis NRRL Y-17324]|uniref:Phytanoyl-CoA dioxygenase n=1 Tax=Suhomyces tanzawaensis NRRL Y-17324 TaxID=984487 RepID=A0A1E4SNV9_9ASCO|nr:phytanoyl-CoA dioxygenase [Suhomyces tanzawaensis NRRL Y-17324]ODV81107.1 phytanoyl-CoA dioxygenase [Suhomyces tanzawaensis NRRL Y-17324]